MYKILFIVSHLNSDLNENKLDPMIDVKYVLAETDGYQFNTNGYLYLYSVDAANSITVDIYGSDKAVVFSVVLNGLAQQIFFIKAGMWGHTTVNIGNNNRFRFYPLK